MYVCTPMWWVAASPIVFFLGLGASLQHRHDEGRRASSVEHAIDAVVGYSVHEHIAIGLHASGSQFGYRTSWIGNSTGEAEVSKMHTLDLAVAVPIDVDRLVVTPWLGRHYATGRRQHVDYSDCMRICKAGRPSLYEIDAPPLTAWGVIVGFDAVVDGANRLTLFVDLQSSTTTAPAPWLASEVQYQYQAATFGIAYRR